MFYNSQGQGSRGNPHNVRGDTEYRKDERGCGIMGECIDCGKTCSGKRCKKCHIKKIGKSFEFDKWKFDTQTKLDNAIKTNLKFSPHNTEINDEFLLAVVNNLHSDVIKRGLICSKLKILNWEGQTNEWEWVRKRYRGGVMVVGFFEPINQWHGVTLYPHKRGQGKIKQKLIACLRQKWSEQAEQREPNAKCEKCGCSKPQLHHDNIKFKDIASECLNYFSDKEINEGIGDDWWWHESEADAVPDNHLAVLHMLKLHEKVNYRWLCWDCHKETF
jgi:hypothetical protein